MSEEPVVTPMQKRFRGYLPVIIDVETGGFHAATDALLEIAAVILKINDEGYLEPAQTIQHHIQPFAGANISEEALRFNKIDPYHPFRQAVTEKTALADLFKHVRAELKLTGCHRAILVGHNPSFDMGFLHAATLRCQTRRNPFHPFSSLDTATLGALAVGQTVLYKAAVATHITFDREQAHSALYDAERTAELFCAIVNKWRDLGGWDSGANVPIF